MTEKLLRNIYFCLICLLIFALAFALHFMKEVLVPFVFAIFIYSAADPLIDWIEGKLKLPRLPAALFVFLGFMALSLGLVFIISSSIGSFYDSADVYKERVVALAANFETYLASYGLSMGDINIDERLQDFQLFGAVKSMTGALAGFMGNFVLIMIFCLFLILGSRSQGQQGELLVMLQLKISKYIVTKLTMSVMTGLLVGIILGLLNVELAFMFALLTVLFNFIPNFGSIFATLLPLPVVLLQYGLGWQFMVVLVGCGSLQFAIGNIIEPKIMGESLDLHPITILLFLIFWGQIWGLPGMFLAVPITAILKIILSRIEVTRPMAEILSGRLPS